MFAIKGVFDGEKIEFLEPVPTKKPSLVAIVFLEVEEGTLQEATEALLLANSPTFKRLVARGLEEIDRGNTRPVEDLLNEL